MIMFHKLVVGISLALMMLLLAGCTAGNGSQADPPGLADLQAITESLPPVSGLEGQRISSAFVDEQIDPHSRIDNSTSVAEDGNSLRLSSLSASSAWAIYSFNTQGGTLDDLEVTTGLDAGEGFWFALADFEDGRWEFRPRSTVSPFNVDLSNAQSEGYISPAGILYFVVLAYDGDDITIDSLTVNIEYPVLTFSVAGTILDDGSQPLQGVQVTATPGDIQVISNSSGEYEFPALEAGEYTITPQAEGVSFDPTEQMVTVADADITGIDFEGTSESGPTTFEADILPIINGSTGETSCLNCHPPTKGHDWSNYAEVFASADLINIRVNLPDADSQQMPLPGPMWSQQSRDAFQAWIDDGKPEN